MSRSMFAIIGAKGGSLWTFLRFQETLRVQPCEPLVPWQESLVFVSCTLADVSARLMPMASLWRR